jgi:hypothetical protein
MAETLSAGDEPPPFHLAQMLPTLLIDVAAPIAVFQGATALGVPTLWALAAGGLPPFLNNLRTWIRSRRLEPLGILVMTFLVIGTAASLITGDVFYSLIKESFLTGAAGLVFFVSLFARRPLMFYITRQFVAGDDAARVAWWNGLWDFPRFRAGMRRVTAVWAVVYMAEALARVGLALNLPAAEVVTISPIMGFGVTILLIIWTRSHMMAVRRRAQTQAAA